MGKTNNWCLYFCAVVANMFAITIGSLLAWHSPVLPKFQSNDTRINPVGTPITVMEVSIASSIIPIASTIGTFLIGKPAEMFGQRKVMIYLATGVVLSFVLMVLVNNIYFYFCLIAIVAICASAGFVLVPIYVTEIAEDVNRGILGCFVSIGCTIGQFYTYTLGQFTTFWLFVLLSGVPCMVFLLFSVFLPESPIFLASKGDRSGALNALQKLRKNLPRAEFEKEFTEKETILNSKQEKNNDIKGLFKTRAGRKAVMLSVGVRVTQQLSGMFVVLSFMGPLFKEAGSNMSPEILTIIVSVVNIAVAFMALNIIDRQGRRFLLLLACFFDGFSMLVLGIYFVFYENNFVLSYTFRVIPFVCVLVFVCMFTFGFSNVPFIIISELLPNEFRSVGSSIVLITGNLSSFAISFAYPLVSEYLGIYPCMFAFSFFCYAGFAFVYFLLPETKGKSFIAIQRELSK